MAKYDTGLGDLVDISWHDAGCWHGWRDLSEVSGNVYKCRSFGIVILITKHGITLASHFNTLERFSEAFVIPLSAIQKVTVLRKRHMEIE